MTGTILLLSVAASAGPDTEGIAAAQSAADAIREAAGADAAFLTAEMLRTKFDPDNLATLMKFPTEEIAVVNLTGAQIRQALERSVSLYPTPSDSFLQVSNLEITFRPKAEPDARIASVTLSGNRMEDGRTYTVAMPVTLARGSQGYFKVWDKERIKTVLSGVTLEKVLADRPAKNMASRWRTAS
ncbi:MAG: 5'-nucleotidase C-terminal domain-containing protein [Chthonomonas sp.]|nr:5'-nucleotidase C-terminal domain-containing protein [Chthonomonas sp.]